MTVTERSDMMRLVALGDSLTEGMVSSSFEMYPYAARLLELTGPGVSIVNKGICGDLTRGMLSRLERDVLALKPDCVIILGGANDIGWGLPQKEIVDNLVTICIRAQRNGIAPVICAVPPVEGGAGANRTRREINAALADYCSDEGIPFVDLYSALADPAHDSLCPEFSDDGLHLSPEGYKKMGEAIFDGFLKGALKKSLK
jgi:lysophospholipase L1-like esterase